MTINKLNHYFSIQNSIGLIILISIIVSCTSETVDSDVKIPQHYQLSNLIKQDSCCDVNYPALQAEVSGIDLYQKQFQLVSFRDPLSGDFKYKLNHSPSQNYESVSQAYINYLKALYPCVTGSGSTWRLSKGNFSSGHTTRQVTRENWINFTPGSLTSTMLVNNPSNFWIDYFEPPISIGAAATPAINGGLYVNEIYSIEYGFWIDGNCNFSQEENDCLGYHNSVNIRIQASTVPLSRNTNNLSISTIEYLDNNGNVFKTKEVETIRIN